MNQTRVSVIVPCRNERAFIGALLDALERSQTPPDEVIVVDGGSTDGTVEIVREHRRRSSRYQLYVVEMPGASIPQAVNVGVSLATGTFIVRLDAHSMPKPDYISRAVPHLEDRRVGVVGGVWSVTAGASGPVAAAIARAGSHALGAGDAAYRTLHSGGVPRDVDTVPFGCFRKEVWADLGGFDESLHTNEDYDFNYRVRRVPRRVVLEPAMESVYYARPTLRALARQYFRYGWWKAQMLRRHPMSVRWRQAAPPSFVILVLMLAIAGFGAPSAWAALAGIVAVYGGAITGTSAWIAVRERRWQQFPALCAAFATIHFCWGGAFLVNIATGAKWPRQPMPAASPEVQSL